MIWIAAIGALIVIGVVVTYPWYTALAVAIYVGIKLHKRKASRRESARKARARNCARMEREMGIPHSPLFYDYGSDRLA